MTVGTHGTTYGGNPLASAVAGKVLELINTPEMLNGVKQRHDWLLATEECARVMTVGTHGTTYGGNPLASAVAGKVLELINTPEMLNGVKQRHDWFVERLNTLNHRYGLFSEVRGLGLLIGCVLNADYAGQAKC